MTYRWIFIAGLLLAPAGALAGEAPAGVPVSYRLPAAGPLPRTYRVTLAIVDVKNPDSPARLVARAGLRER